MGELSVAEKLVIPEGLIWSYQITIRGGRVYHQWRLKGSRGGIHVDAWWSPSGWREENWMGGIEGHSPIPQYSSDRASHEHCWLIDGPCWHDGSSLQFSEQIGPYLPRTEQQMGIGEHREVLPAMVSRYHSWLPTEEQIAEHKAARTEQSDAQ